MAAPEATETIVVDDDSLVFADTAPDPDSLDSTGIPRGQKNEIDGSFEGSSEMRV